MNATEVIALVSVGVTGAGAIATVLANAWLANKRLAHEREMQTSRLDAEEALHESRLKHERAESVRTVAADAYGKSELVLRQINPIAIHTIAGELSEGRDFGPKQAVNEAADALTFVGALGWSEDVRGGATALLDKISKLANAAIPVASSLRSENLHQPDMMGFFDERYDEALGALEAYRKAVAE